MPLYLTEHQENYWFKPTRIFANHDSKTCSYDTELVMLTNVMGQLCAATQT